MKKFYAKIIGIFIIIAGLFFTINSSLTITGNIVLNNVWNTAHSFLGILFLIAGLVLFVISYESGGRLEQLAKIKTSKGLEEAYFRAIDTTKNLRKIITKEGYEIKKGGKHLKVFLRGEPARRKDGLPVIIPEGKKIKKYTAQGILEDLLGYKPKK